MFGPEKIIQEKWITTYQDTYRPIPPPPKKWKPPDITLETTDFSRKSQAQQVLIQQVKMAQKCGEKKIPDSMLENVLKTVNTPPRRPLNILPDDRPKPKPKEFTAEPLPKTLPELKFLKLSTGPNLPDWKTGKGEYHLCTCPCSKLSIPKPPEDRQDDLCPPRKPPESQKTPTEKSCRCTCPVSKAKDEDLKDEVLYWKRCQVTPEFAGISTYDREAFAAMLNSFAQDRSDIMGGACKEGYCSASSGRTYLLKGVDPRVDPAPATERRLKLLMGKIVRGIPPYDPLEGSKKLGPPFFLPQCIPFNVSVDKENYKPGNTPQQNYKVPKPECATAVKPS